MERWLDQLEDMMMQSLCDINNKAIRSFGTNDEFSNWILQNPAMISHCAFYVNWTLKVENIISSIVDMKDYICKLEEYIQDIIMLIRKEMCARDRGTLSSMVLLLIHLRNITEMLVKNKTNSVKDFNWLREMRYYSVEQKIIVQMVTCKFAYGYEYIGNISPLVVTTQTDRYYRLLMGSLENHLCPILRGNTATGKTDICKDLANALAKPFIVFNCTSSVSYGILHMFLRGVIQTGTYFCFDEVDHMQYKQCAILGDLIHKINNAIRLKKDHLQIDSSEIPLNPSCGMFFTSSNKLKENLPENLRLTLRPIMTIDPELLAIIHSLLRSYGYIDWKILGQKISDIHKFLSSNLLTENHYKYDLRHFKICIESLKLMKYNNLQENETIVVRTALEDFYASQLSNQDTELLKYLCDKFFICNDNKLNENIEKLIQKIMEKNNLIGDLYTKKIVHLYHAYKQRRSIILIGNAISGKTTALKCLFEILQDEGKKSNDSKVQNAVINVKSMNMDELYGCLDTNSNEWKDGVFSRIFREYVDNVSLDEKMIIFDTGMDAIWMEGISTVLDNNKTLCLASGEMIKMNEKMNIVFETDTLDYVSPSTISRCSVIYFDENLVTWKSLLMSFVKELDAYLPDEQLSLITDVTEWLFPPVLSFVKKSNAIMLNVSENYAFVNYSRLLRCMLDLENTNLDTNVSIVWLQCIIVFCFIWSIAANLPENERETFDCFFRSILAGECESYPKCRRFKLTKHQLFPEKGTVFDWCCDKKNIAAWIPWLDVFPDNNEKYACNETACQTFLLNAMINAELPVFVIGPPSSGKTSMITNHLSSLPNDKYVINTIPVSATTTSNVMQEIILSGIDRRRKGVYGASMGKKCVIFVDDVNSLSNDVYDTKSTIEILRQIVTYRYCYDKQDSSKIELTDLLFINSCKSFSNINNNNIISERYLHQMNTIFVMKIQDDSISTLFTSMLDKHFSNGFNPQISRLSKAIYTATRQIYDKLVDIYKCDDDNNGGNHFLEFNIKDLFRVLRGITRMTADKCQGMDEMFRLWLHELLRVFGDRIVSYNEREDLLKLIKSSSYQNLRQRTEQYLGHLIPTNENEVTVEHLRNLMFGDYLQHDASRAYDEISDENALKQYMEEKMKEYVLMENIKPIVVFKYFIQHVSRVIRALQNDKGHMILIGLEGSGRKTILKFSAFILNYEVVEINTTYPYNTSDCKNDLKGILLKAGYEGKKLLLMLGDENISNHSSYIMDNINMFLTIGHVPHLFNSDEKSDIMDKMIEIVHHMGSKMDTAPSVLYRLFANRVKENLHIAIILDAAKEDEINEQIWLFPALSNYCTTNIITQWPKDALQEVAIWYFEQYSLIDDKNALNNCVAVCKEIHDVSIEFADSYNKEYGRKIYITPETYFKLLRTFVDIYKEKMEALTITKQRYENGLEKLHTAAKEVTSMKNELQILRPKLLSTSDATEKLMIKIEQNTITIEATKEIVAADEALANDAAAASQAIRDDCESDLAEAEPALQSATTALNTLQPADITVIKAMKNPPHIVKLVLEAICVMKGFKAERRTDVTGNVTEDFWMSSLKLLGDAKFLEGLKTYDKDNIDASVMKIIREKYIPNPDFNPHIVKKVSNACEGLVRWVKAMEIYDRVIKIVGPKKVKLLEAETDYTLQMEKLNDKRNQLAKVVTKLQSLRDELAEKTKQKKELEDSIEMCTQKLDRAGKLIDSLASEKDRWRIVVNELEDKIVKTVGDVLICSAVISYLAPYNYNFRSKVIKQWRLLCQNVNLPLSENSTISSILCDIDQIRSWNMAGLPVDEISIENSLIIANSKYPVVIIDQQGVSYSYAILPNSLWDSGNLGLNLTRFSINNNYFHIRGMYKVGAIFRNKSQVTHN